MAALVVPLDNTHLLPYPFLTGKIDVFSLIPFTGNMDFFRLTLTPGTDCALASSWV
jgi:hypothetical protein